MPASSAVFHQKPKPKPPTKAASKADITKKPTQPSKKAAPPKPPKKAPRPRSPSPPPTSSSPSPEANEEEEDEDEDEEEPQHAPPSKRRRDAVEPYSDDWADAMWQLNAGDRYASNVCVDYMH